MHIVDAIKKANDEMHSNRDFFISSCFVSLKDFSIPKEWIVIFYNPKSNELLEITVNDDNKIEKELSNALQTLTPLDISNIKIDEIFVLELIKKDFVINPLNVLLSIRTKENDVLWSASTITSDFNVTVYDINAKNGNIIKKEVSSLIRRV